MVTAEVGGKPEAARLQLGDDWLSLSKEEIAYTYSPVHKIDPTLLTRVSCNLQLLFFFSIKPGVLSTHLIASL